VIEAVFIRQTIERVVRQDYPNIEYWVVDDGSAGEAVAILREYAGDPHFHWISAPDGGQGDTIKTGVRLTRGELLAWLNADDINLPGAMSRAIRALQDHTGPRWPTARGATGARDIGREFRHARKVGDDSFRSQLGRLPAARAANGACHRRLCPAPGEHYHAFAQPGRVYRGSD